MPSVAEGVFPSGLRWVIEASGTDDDFMTMLMTWRGDVQVGGSGMGGPKFYGSDVVNAGYGITNELPCTEVVRAQPTVDRVVIVTDVGTELEVPLTDPHPVFGVRFGAVELPPAQLPDELYAEINSLIVARQQQHGLRRPPFGGD